MTETSRRLVLVTGASQGIGRASARELARLGCHVIAVARSKAALESLDDEIKTETGEPATLVPMDLTDYKAIDTLGDVLAARFGRIDGLLANAGILGTIGSLQTVTPRSFDETIAINLTSNFRLISALDPLLRRSESPRAAFVTTGVVPRPRAFWGPYQASKWGLEGMIFAYADEADGTSLNVNLFDPGPVRTSMRAKAMPGEDPMTLPATEDVAVQLARLLMKEETRNGARIVFQR